MKKTGNMRVYVAALEESPPKDKGDLLEDLASKLLSAQNYLVDNRNIRKAGMEIDLECSHKVTRSKKIYVECKAYNEDKPINSDIIKTLFATRSVENYNEAWLITSSQLGSDAKGFIEKIEQGEDSNKFAFYTAEKVISALEDAGVVQPASHVIAEIHKLHDIKNKTRDTHLLVCPYGIFWITEYLKAGTLEGFICAHADTGDIVVEDGLLENISKLHFKYKDNNFSIIYKLLDPGDKTTEARKLRGAKLNQQYIIKSTALEIAIAMPSKRVASVNDVFVYPDMEVINVKETNDSSDIISSKEILSKKSKKEWLILGEDLSGKTTLSYMLQHRFVKDEMVAIRLDATGLKSIKPQMLDKAIVKEFINQYDVEGIPLAAVESYIDDICNEVILIIDDFDKIMAKKSSDRALAITHLENRYAKLIIFANGSKALEFTTSNEGYEAFERFYTYKLLQLGHTKRDELIERWIGVNKSEYLDETQMLAKKDDFSKRINTAIGTSYLPTYPFYTLTILEMLESGSKARLNGSEYAALYGHFIDHALILNGVGATDLGFYNTYLAHLAYKLYEDNADSISVEDNEPFFVDYLKEMGLDKSYSKVHRILTDSKILRLEENRYSFNLAYYGYYFFAKYLSDNIEAEETKRVIQKLVDSLYEDDSANIVVFLVHHSKSRDVIDVVIKKAKNQFKSLKLQTLMNDELININTLITEEVRLVLPEGTAAEHRKKRLKKQDEYERKTVKGKDENQKDILDVYGQITSAFRTIDVLGKITSNYYGELKAIQKNLIMHELYELGFRSLRAFMESFESYTGALRSHIKTKIDDKRITSDSDKTKAANQIIYGFTHIIAYSFIKRVSDSVTSPDLVLTIEDALGDKEVPAAMLTSIATKLNFPGGLEKNKTEIIKLYSELMGNSLARDLLRFMVLEHLYKFDVEYKDKHSICTQLNIDVTAVQKRKLKEGKTSSS